MDLCDRNGCKRNGGTSRSIFRVDTVGSEPESPHVADEGTVKRCPSLPSLSAHRLLIPLYLYPRFHLYLRLRRVHTSVCVYVCVWVQVVDGRISWRLAL
jgi:hypothetical protein